MTRARLLLAATVLLFGAATAGSASADDVIELGRRLAQLRGEVDTLSSELAREETEHRDKMRSLARQKAELEAELKREHMRLQRIKLETDKKKATIAEQKDQSDKLLPIFNESVLALRSHVQNALPFRTAERLAEIDKIVEQRNAGLLTTERALARLWSFVEDEVRLTKESGLHRQTLVVDGAEQLVDVVRIGMVMLFFKTSDDVVGYAVKHAESWTTHTETDTEGRKRIVGLFDSFKKQIRVGYFEIPNALWEQTP